MTVIKREKNLISLCQENTNLVFDMKVATNWGALYCMKYRK